MRRRLCLGLSRDTFLKETEKKTSGSLPSGSASALFGRTLKTYPIFAPKGLRRSCSSISGPTGGGLRSPPGWRAPRARGFGPPPPRAATAQRALEGFTRSLAKEIGRGVTVQLLYVAQGAEGEFVAGGA